MENIVSRYSDEEFHNNFRMSRRTFQAVLDLVVEKIAYKICGRPTLSPRTQLCMGLWYLATPDSYRWVGKKIHNLKKITLIFFVSDLSVDVLALEKQQD